MLLNIETSGLLLCSCLNTHNYSRMFATNITQKNEEKINGVFETFDRIIINGFSNKLIRKELFDNIESKYIINKTTRLLSKLKAHGIIKK